MKKEAIIDLIKGDLEEIGTLVETFREPDRIAKDFIDLLRQKCDSVSREVSLLSYWSTENMPQATPAELAAQVRNRDEERLRRPAEEANSLNVETAKSQDSQRREEVSDYFADELDQMDDPFADIKFCERSTDGEIAAPESEETATEDQAESGNEPEQADATPKGEQYATVGTKPEQESFSATTEPEPAIAEKHTANAADIATYGTPVSDITKAIGINDRFLYQRELFKGSKADFDSTIAAINASSNYTQAYIFLKQSFGWDETDPTVEAFLKAVHRRFI